MRFARFILPILLCLAMQVAFAEEAVIAVRSGAAMDEIGQSLRRAVNAYEEAQQNPVPQTWTRLSLMEGENKRLGDDLFVALLPTTAAGARVTVVDADGPHEGTFAAGREQVLGPLRVLLIGASSSGRSADIMIRAAEEPALLGEPGAEKSTTKITGLLEEKRFVVESRDAGLLRFARKFVAAMDEGKSAEEAARAGWEQEPPANPNALALDTPQPQEVYTDSKNYAWGSEADVFAAGVTLRLLRGDDIAIRELSNSWAYNSAGNMNSNPNVRVRSGDRGTTVDVGSGADALKYRLRALEKDGRVRVESETYVYVPMGGRTRFELQGPGGMVYAYLAARRAGKGALLSISNTSGDWSFVGGLSTTVRMNNGQTVTLARNTFSRTQTQTSSVPIVSGVPYAGALFGNERTVRENSSYALIATMEFQ
ncbi:hypothetical protein IT571_02220 [Candidatus Sumerlaeota bacterium]|nr:hypothetical protein [Candidatus Sumerlaeota bacterium]